MKYTAIFVLCIMVAIGCYADGLPDTTGQAYLKRDVQQIKQDSEACSRMSGDDGQRCIQFVMKEREQVEMDAQILSTELTHEHILAYNKTHSRQMADVADIVEMMVKMHDDMAAIHSKYRKVLFGGVSETPKPANRPSVQ